MGHRRTHPSKDRQIPGEQAAQLKIRCPRVFEPAKLPWIPLPSFHHESESWGTSKSWLASVNCVAPGETIALSKRAQSRPQELQNGHFPECGKEATLISKGEARLQLHAVSLSLPIPRACSKFSCPPLTQQEVTWHTRGVYPAATQMQSGRPRRELISKNSLPIASRVHAGRSGTHMRALASTTDLRCATTELEPGVCSRMAC